MIRPLEVDEQIAVVGWLRLRQIRHYANVSENNTHKQNRKYAMIAEGKARKAGKIKGIPDLTIFLKDRILYIELKRQQKKLKNGGLSNSDSKPSTEQIDVMEWINTFPYAVAQVCYGAHEAIDFIKAQEMEISI